LTCIVGLEHDGKVTIGGDSAGVSGWSLDVRADEKVFKRGVYAFGFTSSFRMGQLLRYAPLDIEAKPSLKDLDAYMVTGFVDAVRSCLKAGGYVKTDNGQEEGGTFLVGVKGRLYTVESDFQVAQSTAGFASVGCGAQVALGAMHVLPIAFDPTDRVTMALRAAERFSAGVRGPFHVVTV